MGIKQLAKPQTGDPDVDRVLAEHVDKLNPILRSLPPSANGQLIQGQWNTPKFLNGWVNFNGGFRTAAYMIDTQGFVHLRGLVQNPVGVPDGTVVFVLPTGFRPAGICRFIALGEGVPPSTMWFFDVNPDGTVLARGIVAAGGFRSLDSVTFDTRLT